jgi:hypothetical protein
VYSPVDMRCVVTQANGTHHSFICLWRHMPSSLVARAALDLARKQPDRTSTALAAS